MLYLTDFRHSICNLSFLLTLKIWSVSTKSNEVKAIIVSLEVGKTPSIENCNANVKTNIHVYLTEKRNACSRLFYFSELNKNFQLFHLHSSVAQSSTSLYPKIHLLG